MARQVWGTFSVMDHCDPNAFVAEVMLYDRLVIPSPPENDRAEWGRWEKQGWQPTRLDKLIQILGDRAYVVEWNEGRKQRWRTRYEGGKDIAQNTADWAFAATRTELTIDLPKNVTGIQTVSNYTSLPELEKDLGLQQTEAMPMYGGAAVAVLGHQFLVPGDPKWEHEDLLKEAVDLSSEKTFQRKRAAFWRWQREFFDDKGIIEVSALKAAAEEMQDMLEEERVLIQKKKIYTTSQYAFLVGSVVLGLVGGPLTAVAVGTAFVSVGQFISDKFFNKQAGDSDKPVALLRDIKKHFGWK